jgi:periplasmic protein TonB
MNATLEVHEPEVRDAAHVWPATRSLPLASPVEQPAFFADILLESDGLQRRRRKWSAVLSFGFQCLVVGTLLIVPLMFTDELPKQQLLTFLVAPPPPPPPSPAAAAEAVKVVRQIQSDIMNGQLRTPGRIPAKIQMIKEDEAPPPLVSGGGVIGGVPGGIPGGQLGGVIGGIISSASNLNAVPKLVVPAAPKRMRISQGVTTGMLVRKIEPKYPLIAQQARIQGQVVLNAIISKAGEIENLEVVSGHPMLVPAAIDAVKQWHYRPFLLNGEPIEVETTVTVTFHIAG